MGIEIRPDYNKTFLLPPCLDDWIGKDDPARFIRDFVDLLDIEELGFRIPEAFEGRPPYAADLLLKVWLYGYMEKIRATRKLEKACRQHFSLVWLTGMNYPDHNTLWRFWVANKKALRTVFKQSVLVAHKAGLVGMALHAVDGTKITAQVSNQTGWHGKTLEKLLKRLDVSIDEMMREVESAEENERGDYLLPEKLQDAKMRRDEIKEALRELDKVDRKHLHPRDPDARMMKCKKRTHFAYNAQAVVDDKSGLIMAEDVVNAENDTGQLTPMLGEVERNLGGTAEETVADGGYYSPEQLAEAEEHERNVLVSIPENTKNRWHKGGFHSSNFVYDERQDVFICPLGRQLTYDGSRTRKRKHRKYRFRIYRCRCFRECPMRWQCSLQKRGRTIEQLEYYKAVENQRTKQFNEDKMKLLKKRKAIVEIAFAHIKEHQAFRRWTVRGLGNVKTQWSLVCTAFNLRKLYRYWTEGVLAMT